MNGEIIERSLALVGRSLNCVFANKDENGVIHMRAMMKTSMAGLKEFWFCSNTSSRKINQIRDDPNASLYFMDEMSFEGLFLTGKAEATFDDAKRTEFWQDGMKIYWSCPGEPPRLIFRTDFNDSDHNFQLRAGR